MSLGAKLLPRPQFIQLLRQHVAAAVTPGSWNDDVA
jgi:hypothetical protein